MNYFFKVGRSTFKLTLLTTIFIGLTSCNQTGTTFFSEKRVVYLKTNLMVEADDSILDSTMGPSLIRIFPCNRAGKTNSQVPCADVFLCKLHNRTNALLTDTIMVLDTGKTASEPPTNLDYYWTGLKRSAKFEQCKISVPAEFENQMKRYKYKYASVTLVTDDFDYKR